ncbi:MAG: molybdopterin molybdotransferase MoeA [Bacillota bacterium]
MKLMRVSSPEEVLNLIGEQFKALASKTLKLEKAGGLVLAEAVYSPENVPDFNRSTVDGYAVAARDTFGAGEGMPAMLEYSGEVLMGETAPSIQNGQCCLVHTGGMLPAEADAVVMIEDTEPAGNIIQCFSQVAPGENVIHRGEDLKQGSLVLSRGHRLRSPEIGLLASLGLTELVVHRKPVIGLFTSGDELVNYNTRQLRPGQIRDSNAPALIYLAEQKGAEITYGGILPDDFSSFLEKSCKMLEAVDLLVFTGGSSVGSRDHTANTMQELGRPGLLVEGISIQPGKPTLLANCDGKPVLGLPGHPVSALNIFALFGGAILRRLNGQDQNRFIPTVKARLTRNISSRTGRTDYVRVRLEQTEALVKAEPVFGRSGMLRTLAEADGLLKVPAEKEGLSAGEQVEITIWD